MRRIVWHRLYCGSIVYIGVYLFFYNLQRMPYIVYIGKYDQQTNCVFRPSVTRRRQDTFVRFCGSVARTLCPLESSLTRRHDNTIASALNKHGAHLQLYAQTTGTDRSTTIDIGTSAQNVTLAMILVACRRHTHIFGELAAHRLRFILAVRCLASRSNLHVRIVCCCSDTIRRVWLNVHRVHVRV